MLETGSIGFATAFVAGVISFLSPCVLPLVPGYLSYVAGTSLERLATHRTRRAGGRWASPPASCSASRRVRGVRRQRHALGLLLRSYREARHRRRRHHPPLRPAPRSAAADRAARAGGALSSVGPAGRAARRLPHGPRLRLRLDALHRPGAGRDPDNERLHRRPRHRAWRCSPSIRWAWALPFLLAALFTDVLLRGCAAVAAPGAAAAGAGVLLAVIGRPDDHRPARERSPTGCSRPSGSHAAGPDRDDRRRVRRDGSC